MSSLYAFRVNNWGEGDNKMFKVFLTLGGFMVKKRDLE